MQPEQPEQPEQPQTPTAPVAPVPELAGPAHPGSDAWLHTGRGLLSGYTAIPGILSADPEQRNLLFDTPTTSTQIIPLASITKVKFYSDGKMYLVTPTKTWVFALYDEKGTMAKDWLDSLVVSTAFGKPHSMANYQLGGMLDAYTIETKWAAVFDQFQVPHNDPLSPFGARKPFKIAAIVFGTILLLLFILLAIGAATSPGGHL